MTEPTFLTLTLDQLEPASDNLRTTIEDLDDLKASIKAQGLIQAITVTQNGSGKYKVIAGHRRVAALSELAAEGVVLPRIPALFREADDGQRTEMMLVENLQRQDLNPIEEALGFQRLVDTFGLTQKQAAEKVGCDQAHISRRISLLDLPAKVQDRVAKGKMAAETGYALAKIGDPEVVLYLFELEGDTVSEWRINQAVKAIKSRKALDDFVAKCTKAGITVIDRSELGEGYERTGAEYTSPAEAKKLTLEEDQWFIATVNYSDKPVLQVWAKRPKSTGNAKSDEERRKAKVERLLAKAQRQQLIALVEKPERAAINRLAVEILTAYIGYNWAREIGVLLDLEPIKRSQKQHDGSVKEVADWPATVTGWMTQGETQLRQTQMAVLLTTHRHSNPVRQYVDERVTPAADLRKEIEAELDDKPKPKPKAEPKVKVEEPPADTLEA